MANIQMISNGDDKLWQHTYVALTQGQWGEARKGLDTLNSEHGACAIDLLPDLATLGRMGVALPTGGLADVIGDRIDLWNRHVERRAERMLRAPRPYRTY